MKAFLETLHRRQTLIISILILSLTIISFIVILVMPLNKRYHEHKVPHSALDYLDEAQRHQVLQTLADIDRDLGVGLDLGSTTPYLLDSNTDPPVTDETYVKSIVESVLPTLEDPPLPVADVAKIIRKSGLQNVPRESISNLSQRMVNRLRR